MVISDGCMSGKQTICMDLNKWCICFIYTCQVVYIFHIHLLGGVYEKYTTCAQNRDQHISISIYIYIIECLFVCLFVHRKRQNYGTD